MLGLVTGKCFDKGPEIRVESGNGRHSKWRSPLNSPDSICLTQPNSCADPFNRDWMFGLINQHMITLFVSEQLVVGFYIDHQLSLELQIILVFSQFLLSLSIFPNNGCKANKHFLLLLATCSSNLDEGGWEGKPI